jgi:RNA ligase
MIKFPEITHIDQVREAIKGRPEFIEAQREVLLGNGIGKYTVFNYLVSHTDSFDCPIRRECRGLIFDKDGKVLSRRFHKFFNAGEKPETTNVDLSQPHVVLDKRDGSMITPLVFNGTMVRWATKMGVTDIGEMAYRFANKRNYYNFAIECHEAGWTPIFEYTSPKNRIVLPYKEENLVLLAMRHNITGEYASMVNLEADAKAHNIPLVDQFKGDLKTIEDQSDIEGVVIRFETGHMVKVKTEWYCAIHMAKENILFEKNVIKLILEEKIDDVIPFLPEEDQTRIRNYSEVLLASVDLVEYRIRTVLDDSYDMSRKDFAMKIAPTFPPFERNLMFGCWDKTRPVRAEVIKAYLKHTKSQNDVDSIRPWIGSKWEPVGSTEDYIDSVIGEKRVA